MRLADASRQALVALGLLTGIAGHSQEIPGYPREVYAGDPREMAMVPKYCMYTLLFRASVPGGGDAQMAAAWKSQLGESFIHMHHYCAGMMKANRAQLLTRDAMTRNFYYSDAVIEYDYVITRVPNDYILLPEMLTRKGEALMNLGKGPAAVYEFERAIETKADYWPPYAKLSDYYKGSGDLRKAREVLESGLAQVPDAQALRRRLDEVDKKPVQVKTR